MLHVKIITPERSVHEADVDSVSCRTTEGEITILSHHGPLLTLLKDGVITLRIGNKEEYFSAGGGYVETDGKTVRILISRAFGQNELDETKIKLVQQEAEKLLKEKPSRVDRAAAMGMLRRSEIDLKVLRKRRRV